jgi:hypothetical protein
MIMEKFGNLAPFIEFEGCFFGLMLFNNGRDNDSRLCYRLESVERASKHYVLYDRYGCWENPFSDGNNQGFLLLAEHIATDEDLVTAIDYFETTLKGWGFFDGKLKMV